MADGVVPIQSGEGSFLCSVSLYRMPNGDIRAALQHMPAHVIEAEQTITARLFRSAGWCIQGALDLMRQGVRFDDETRASVENDNDPPNPPQGSKVL